MALSGVDGRYYTRALADFASLASFDNLPSDVVHDTKRVIVDTLACIVGGASIEKGRIEMEIARELGGPPEATVIVDGARVACHNAVLANADLANALDADDTFLNFSHFANVCVANALAVGERVKASGKDMISAVATSFDVTARVALSMIPFQIVGQPPDERVELAATNGMSYVAPGGAVAAGKMLGLGEGQMAQAIGLACGSAIVPSAKKHGTRERFGLQKYTPYGIIAQSSLLSALLAAKGYTGDPDILDGDLGFWRFAGSLDVSWEPLIAELGKKWWISSTSLKPYPLGRYLNAPLDLFYKIRDEHNIAAEEIESVTLGIHPAALGIKPLGNASPDPDPDDPETQVNLAFNGPYAVAMAATRITPGPAWFKREQVSDPVARRVMKKVRVAAYNVASEELLKLMKQDKTKRFEHCPCKVTVVANGRTIEAVAEYAKGDPWLEETRMTDGEISQKFLNFSDGIIPRSKAERAIETLWALEQVDDLGKIAGLMTAHGS